MWVFVGILGAIWSICWQISARLHSYDKFPLDKNIDGQVYARVKAKSQTIAIVVPGQHSANVRFRKEAGRDIWAKSIGLADEMAVGEAHFDKAVYVESDSPAIQFAIAQDGKLRQSVVTLLEPPVKRIEIIDGFVAAQFSKNPFSTEEIDDAAVARIVPLLHDINSSISRVEDRVKAAGTDPSIRRSRWILLCSWAMLSVGYFLQDMQPPYGPVLDNVPLWRWSVVSGSIVAAVIAAFFLSIIGRSSVRHLVLFDFLCAGFLGTIFLTYYAAKSLNQSTDTDPPELIQATVDEVARRWVTGRKGRSGRWVYSMHVSALYGAGAATANLRIPGSLFSHLRRGDTIIISIQPGRLGARWISELKVINPLGKEIGPWPGTEFTMRHPTLLRRLW